MKKLYYGDRLVYQSFLPVGTVLWSGNKAIVGTTDWFDFELKGLNDSLSNLGYGVSIAIKEDSESRIITKETLLSGKEVSISDKKGSRAFYLYWKPKTNIISISRLYGLNTIIKITTL